MITLLAILTKIGFAAKRVFWFAIDNWKVVLPIVALIIISLFVLRACNKPASLNEKQIQKNQEAIASGERKKMEEALLESRVAEQQIDANRADAENKKLKALDDARKEAREMSNEDLAKTLEGLK